MSISACESLSETSPLPPEDASDLDAGQPPSEPTTSSSGGGSSSSSGDPITSGRIRFTNLVQGPDQVDLCVKGDGNVPWETRPNFAGLGFGETSGSELFLAFPANPPSFPGSRYTFRVVAAGQDCNANPASIAAITTAVVLRPSQGITVVGVGRSVQGEEPGDAIARATSMGDQLVVPATAALFRVFHGVPDIAAFDVVVNGETLLTGVKYGGPLFFPYTTTTGFATVNAGIEADSTLTLRSGTTTRSFVIPERLRRGVANTVYVGGTKDDLTITLCSERSSEEENGRASCRKLVAE